MAKRYHQSKKARHSEHMGMEKYERGGVKHHSPVPNVVHGMRTMKDQYAGHEESKKQKAMDHALIHEDHKAPALLPQHVIDTYWPTAYNTHMGMVDDLFSGSQKQLHEDYNDLGREMNPKKY
jgi:hypothetical protein